MNPQIVITGSNGLIGSAFVQHFKKTYDLVTFDVSDPVNPVDITNKEQVLQALEKSTATHVVHFAAFTDVTAAWEQTGDTSGIAYKVNVTGTQNLVKACNQLNKHLIHISTAYVFDGEKSAPYVEEDELNPIEWYGKTKALAEEYVQTHAHSWTILRIDQPFRPDTFAKLDTLHRIAEQLAAGTLPPQFVDHYFGPTWIPDFVKIIGSCIKNKRAGLYHATSGESWNNYDFAQAVATKLHSSTPVNKSYLADYLKTQQRPYQKNTALDCTKLFTQLEFKPVTIQEAIEQASL